MSASASAAAALGLARARAAFLAAFLAACFAFFVAHAPAIRAEWPAARFCAFSIASTLPGRARWIKLGAVHKAWWLQPGHPGRFFRFDFCISPTGRTSVDAP